MSGPDELVCVLCSVDFSEERMVVSTCGHAYHNSCNGLWPILFYEDELAALPAPCPICMDPLIASDDGTPECEVCYLPMPSEEAATIEDCMHSFHITCLAPILVQQEGLSEYDREYKYPKCRANFDPQPLESVLSLLNCIECFAPLGIGARLLTCGHGIHEICFRNRLVDAVRHHRRVEPEELRCRRGPPCEGRLELGDQLQRTENFVDHMNRLRETVRVTLLRGDTRDRMTQQLSQSEDLAHQAAATLTRAQEENTTDEVLHAAVRAVGSYSTRKDFWRQLIRELVPEVSGVTPEEEGVSSSSTVPRHVTFGEPEEMSYIQQAEAQLGHASRRVARLRASNTDPYEIFTAEGSEHYWRQMRDKHILETFINGINQPSAFSETSPIILT